MEEEELVINFQRLREEARSKILQILDEIQGPKTLALDPTIIGPLGLIIEASVIKEHGVTQFCQVENEDLNAENREVIYIVHPTIEMMKNISQQVRRNYEENNDHHYRLFMCPRVTTVCEQVLVTEGVFADFDCLEPLPIYLIPLEHDLLSMQFDKAFRDLVLDRDFTSYYYIARAILHLENEYGPIPIKHGKGIGSCQILKMLEMLEEEDLDFVTEHNVSEIHSAVLIDREVDMVTPLLTQFTYEGLIDELFGINNNIIRVNPRILERDDTTQQVSLLLNSSSDPVYQEIRDLNFCVLKSLLRQKLAYINETYQEKDTKNTVTDIKNYIPKLKKAKNEAEKAHNHLNLAVYITQETMKNPFFNLNLEIEHEIIQEPNDHILEYIESLIGKDEPLHLVLKLLWLMSLTSNGLKPRSFDFFRKEILQTYGFDKILSIANLEKAGLLKKQESKSTWDRTKKQFNLLLPEVNQHNPDDIAYAYSGYAPLTVRLLEQLGKPGGWNTDSVRNIPGGDLTTTMNNLDDNQLGNRKIILVFFVGGVTYAEIATIRYLNKKFDGELTYVIATTHIVNSKNFISSISDNIENELERSSLD